MSEEFLATIVATTITMVGTIIVAVMQIRGEIKRDKAQKKHDRLAKLVEHSVNLTYANTKLTIGTAFAVKNGKANGELEEGMKDVQKAQKEYDEFFHSEVAKSL